MGKLGSKEKVNKLRQLAKMIRKEKTREYIFRMKDQNKTADKSDNATRRGELKDIGKRRETQKITRYGQTIQIKQDFPKYRKKYTNK